MRSRPCGRPTARPDPPLAARGLALLFLAGAVLGCAGGGTAPPERRAPAEGAFLVSPLEGYREELASEVRAAIVEAHRGLVSGASTPAEAAARAAGLLEAAPGLAPARLLTAQAAFVEARYRVARDEAAALVAEHPGYVAAGLLAGRAAEELGELVAAYESYRLVAEASSRAAERAAALRPRVLDVVARRVGEALAAGRTDVAEREVARLEAWAPGELATLEAVRRVAEATGAGERELDALRELARRTEPSREEILRRGHLEGAVGDVGAGVEILQRLAADLPDDPEVREELHAASFRFRLLNLPEPVQEAARASELTRRQLAVLLYWLVPEVRTATATAGRIATDVLDDPHRREIIRVINLGLLEVDPALRRFEPHRRVRRERALRALLRLKQRSSPPSACLASGDETLGGVEAVCATAAACRLLVSPADCRPEETVSGGEALDWIRRAIAE